MYRLSASNSPNGDKGYFKNFKPHEIKSLEELGDLMLTHSLCTQLFSSEKMPNKEGKFPVVYRKTTDAVIDTGDVIFFDIDNASPEDSKTQCENTITLKQIVHAFEKQGWGCAITPSKSSNNKWKKFHIAAFTSAAVPNYKTDKQAYRDMYAAVASVINLELDPAMMSAIQNLTPALGREVIKIVEGNPVDINIIADESVSGFSKRVIKKNDNSSLSSSKNTNGGFDTVVIKKKKFKLIKGLSVGTRCNCPRGKQHSDGQGKDYGFVNNMKGITCNGCQVNYHWLSDEERWNGKLPADIRSNSELDEDPMERIISTNQEIEDVVISTVDFEKQFTELVAKGVDKDQVYELIASLDDIQQQRVWAKSMVKMNRSAYDGLLLKSMMSSIRVIYENRPDIKKKRKEEAKVLASANILKVSQYPYPDYIKVTDDMGVVLFDVKSTRQNMKKLLEINSIKSSYDVITRSIHASYDGKNYDFSKEADTVRSDVVGLGQMDKDLYFSKKADIDRRLIADHYDLTIQGKHINPLIDFIKKKHKKSKNKGVGAIKTMLKALNSETGSKKYQSTILRKWLIQCVAAWDGCKNKGRHKNGIAKYETVFVLSGNQGRGKTKFFNHLMSPFKHIGNYFLDGATFQKGDKDNLMQITSYALVELGELDRLKTTGASDFKAFTSKQVDEFRMPYARTALTYPRHTSFCGSVNHAEFLNDITGARRFLIMEAGEIRLDEFIPMDVWIEVWELYIHGESWWLDDDLDMRIIEERDKINDGATDNGVAQDLYVELTGLIPEVKGNVSKGRLSATKIISYLTGSNNVNGFERSQLISLIRKGGKYKIANNGLIELGEDGVNRLRGLSVRSSSMYNYED